MSSYLYAVGRTTRSIELKVRDLTPGRVVSHTRPSSRDKGDRRSQKHDAIILVSPPFDLAIRIRKTFALLGYKCRTDRRRGRNRLYPWRVEGVGQRSLSK
jgi:hypothetical protein